MSSAAFARVEELHEWLAAEVESALNGCAFVLVPDHYDDAPDGEIERLSLQRAGVAPTPEPRP